MNITTGNRPSSHNKIQIQRVLQVRATEVNDELKLDMASLEPVDRTDSRAVRLHRHEIEKLRNEAYRRQRELASLASTLSKAPGGSLQEIRELADRDATRKVSGLLDNAPEIGALVGGASAGALVHTLTGSWLAAGAAGLVGGALTAMGAVQVSKIRGAENTTRSARARSTQLSVDRYQQLLEESDTSLPAATW